jgi:hypothetical protein
MEFGEPHHIETPTLGRIDLREAFLKRVSLGSTGQSRELVEHAKFHSGDLLLRAAGRGHRPKDSSSQQPPAIMARIK